jgi:hypothetical protein
MIGFITTIECNNGIIDSRVNNSEVERCDWRRMSGKRHRSAIAFQSETVSNAYAPDQLAAKNIAKNRRPVLRPTP